MAERETVEAKQLSLGHWFESGWTETFLFVRIIINVQKNVPKEPRKTLDIVFVQLLVDETLVTTKTGNARNASLALLAIQILVWSIVSNYAFMAL